MLAVAALLPLLVAEPLPPGAVARLGSAHLRRTDAATAVGVSPDGTLLAAADAYMLCSLKGDLHVTQTVDGNKGIHCMMEKKLIGG